MVNNFILQARLVADPEMNQTNSGTNVVNFRVAWSEKYKERENKLFLECKAFGYNAEFICKYFRKGQEIILEGKLLREEWGEGTEKRSKVVLEVGKAHFCGKREDSGNVQSNLTTVDSPEGLPF